MKQKNKNRGAKKRQGKSSTAVALRRIGTRRRNGQSRGGASRRGYLPRSIAPRGQAGRKRRVLEGVFHGSRAGFGFVTAEGEESDFFIPLRDCGAALDGDRVKIEILAPHPGKDEPGAPSRGMDRTEGRVVELTDPAATEIVGMFRLQNRTMEAHPHLRAKGARKSERRGGRQAVILPCDSRFGGLTLLPDIPCDENGIEAQDGDLVLALPDRASLRMEGKGRQMRAQILRVFGAAEDRGANYEAILEENGIRTEFSPAVLAEAARVAAEPLSDRDRPYLSAETGEMIFTIDGAGAKDLDDAISLRRNDDKTYELSVHIADVSHYVRPHTEVDREAMARGTSVYFTDRVVPMLPEALSNGACSLNAGEDKYAMTARMQLSTDGRILSTRIERTVIRSCVRGVYDEVNSLFSSGKRSPFYPKYEAVYPTLLLMRRLYRVLARRAAARGMLDLDRPEARILLDRDGMPAEIVREERGDAERMIEQFMLTANEGVATLLHERGIPCVYRVHDRPTDERLRDFTTYCYNLGLDVRALSDPGAVTALSFASLLSEARERGMGAPLSLSLLRTMAKAKYSPRPTGHFGLGISLYCHFTSPIRRLSDLATHRIIGGVLLGGESPRKYEGYAARAAEAASETELRAMAAERQIDALYKCLYLSERIGEEYDATVSSVTSFGLYAELENTCEGLIPLSEMDGYYLFDPERLTLSCGSTVYRLGDAVRVRIEEADIPARRVRFSLLPAAAEAQE